MNLKWGNDRLNKSRPFIKKVFNFYIQNKKEILWLIIIGVIIYFIFIFVGYWDILEKGFQTGWDSIE